MSDSDFDNESFKRLEKKLPKAVTCESKEKENEEKTACFDECFLEATTKQSIAIFKKTQGIRWMQWRTPGGRRGTLGTVDEGRVGYFVSCPT